MVDMPPFGTQIRPASGRETGLQLPSATHGGRLQSLRSEAADCKCRKRRSATVPLSVAQGIQGRVGVVSRYPRRDPRSGGGQGLRRGGLRSYGRKG